MIAECDKQIGFCLACRTPSDETVTLVHGVADGRMLSDKQFEASKEETELIWRQRYPEAEIVHLACPAGIQPVLYAQVEAIRKVTN